MSQDRLGVLQNDGLSVNGSVSLDNVILSITKKSLVFGAILIATSGFSRYNARSIFKTSGKSAWGFIWDQK
jgi:hypothetical protein